MQNSYVTVYFHFAYADSAAKVVFVVQFITVFTKHIYKHHLLYKTDHSKHCKSPAFFPKQYYLWKGHTTLFGYKFVKANELTHLPKKIRMLKIASESV